MIAAALLALLGLASIQDGLDSERVKAIDQVFQRWNRLASPGCVVAVYQDGQMEYGKGFGSANLEHRVPIRTDTVFRIASTSKQFTAACVVLLELDGELSFRDDVRKWIPELPEYSERILVEDLVHHTSGLRDYLQLLEWAGHSDEAEIDTELVFDLVTRQRGLNHLPGERHSYTNTGYFLLSVVVERVSGDSLRKFAKRRLFEPLGMQHTFFNDDADEVIPKRATGYERSWLSSAFRISETRLEVVGDGAVFTSAEDLLRWDRNFYDPKVGGQPFLKRMLEPAVLRNGEVLDYASGLAVNTWRGQPVVSHGGAFVGFRSQMIRFPEKRTSIVCLSNRADFDPTSRCHEVAAAIFEGLEDEEDGGKRGGKRARDERDSENPFTAPEAQACVGDYSSDELGVTWSFRASGKRLHLDGYRKQAQSLSIGDDGSWNTAGAKLQFHVDSDGNVDGFTLSAPRARGVEFGRVRD